MPYKSRYFSLWILLSTFEILWNCTFSRTSVLFMEEFKIIDILWIISIRQSKLPANHRVLALKMKQFLKLLKKLLRFFDKSQWKKWVSPPLTKYFCDFCVFYKRIYPLKITPGLSNNFFQLGRWTFRRSALQTVLNYKWQ